MFKFLLLLLFSSICVLVSPSFGLKNSHGDPIELIELKMKSFVEASYQDLQYIFTYKNSQDHDVTAIFHFPHDKEVIFNKFEAIFPDDRTIVGEIVDKEDSQLKSDSSYDFLNITVGKLQANETVKITFAIIKPLKIHFNRFYELKFPAITSQEPPFIFGQQDLKEWNIIIEIHSNTPITLLRFDLCTSDDSKRVFANVTVPTNKDYIVCFAPKNLSDIDIIAAIHPDNPNDRGFFLNIIPDLKHFSDEYVQNALEDPTHNGFLELQKDVFTLEQRRRPKYKFLFMIDRSDSMKGTRFETLKKTLIELLQTLPPHSPIYLLSFGTTYELHQIEGRNPSAEEAVEFVKTLEADMGEKNLLEAIQYMREEHGHFVNPVILLTDGKISNSRKIGDYITRQTYNDLIFCTLGIGAKDHSNILRDIANAGRCWSDFVAENENLGDRAIHLMQKGWPGQKTHLSVQMMCKDFKDPRVIWENFRGDVFPGQAFSQWIDLEKTLPLESCEFNLRYLSQNRLIYYKTPGEICYNTKCLTFEKDARITDRYHKIEYHKDIRKIEARSNPHWSMDSKKYLIKKFTKYPILSDFTSLVPVIKRNTKEQPDQSKNFQSFDL